MERQTAPKGRRQALQQRERLPDTDSKEASGGSRVQRREETGKGERLGDRGTQRTTTLRGQQEQKGEGNEQGQAGSSMSKVGCSPSRKKGKGRVPMPLFYSKRRRQRSRVQAGGYKLTDDPASLQLFCGGGSEQRQGWKQEEPK